MMVLVFLLLAVAMAVVMWTQRRRLAIAIFWVDIVLAVVVFMTYATDKINIQL